MAQIDLPRLKRPSTTMHCRLTRHSRGRGSIVEDEVSASRKPGKAAYDTGPRVADHTGAGVSVFAVGPLHAVVVVRRDTLNDEGSNSADDH